MCLYYSIKHLLGLVTSLVADDAGVKGKVIQRALAPYLKRAAPKSLVLRLRRAARDNVYGKADDQIKKLPGICAALRKKGHSVSIAFWDTEELKQDLDFFLKDDHDRLQLDISKRDRTPFDYGKVSLEMPSISNTKKHLKRWTITPSTAMEMYPRVHAYSASDFTSVKVDSGGNMAAGTYWTETAVWLTALTLSSRAMKIKKHGSRLTRKQFQPFQRGTAKNKSTQAMALKDAPKHLTKPRKKLHCFCVRSIAQMQFRNYQLKKVAEILERPGI